MKINQCIPWTVRQKSLRQAGVGAIHLALFCFSGIAAFELRFEFSIREEQLRYLATALPIWLLLKSIAFVWLGEGRSSWRFVSISDVRRLLLACLAGSVASAPAILLAAPGFPRSIYVLDFCFSLMLTAGFRFMVRLLAETGDRRLPSECYRTFIYGAGAAGVMLLRETRSNPKMGYRVCGFIDDDATKVGKVIQGIPVVGSGASLSRLARTYRVGWVLIAIPSASGADMVRILGFCTDAKLKFRRIPGLDEIVRDGPIRIRDVAVEDLLGRNPVSIDSSRVQAKLEGKVVLVTGAAGSIGAELCRQIARFRPGAIVGFEIAESALFQIEQEFKRTFPDVRFHPEIGSIRDPRRLTEVFERHQPSIVYHAAAYKHVPLMESHSFEAIENNVFGTLNVALAAAGNPVEDFVLISSDKAVRPASIMGATKRLAELAIRSLQNGGIKFVSVRFGNVLGSSGSVLPIFKDQIARGGPVTVTDAAMRRFFMTIPEACQLVLQASTMGNGGEIFILDMGEPVKIVDLARNLILLSGLRPHQDIGIIFTGLRPGEKLYEELNLPEENTLATRHEKISILAGHGLRGQTMESYLDALRAVCERRDLSGLILLLKDIIPDYNPSGSILHRAISPAIDLPPSPVSAPTK